MEDSGCLLVFLFAAVIIIGIIYLLAYVVVAVIAAALLVAAVYGLVKTIINYVDAFVKVMKAKSS